LEDPGLVEGRRGIGVVFEELGRPRTAIGEVEAAVERRITPEPARPHGVPGMPGDMETGEDSLVAHRAVHEVQAERVQVRARRLDARLDLREGEGIGVALVPIGLAVQAVEVEAVPGRHVAPVGACADGHAAHQPPPP
jgi:hypothetical protein